MSEAMIRVTGLTIHQGQRALLVDTSFEVLRGERFVILGGSGSGKSTLLRYMAGLETPRQGRVEIAGREASLDGSRPRWGVMLQSGALLGSLDVGDNVALALHAWTDLPDDAIDALVRAKLRLVGLRAAASKRPSELSGGMYKRAAIARAMALEPELLFLDEPSAGLDPALSAQIDQLLLALNEALGVTLVMVTHDMESIEAVAQRCIMLDADRGGIVATGSPAELRAQNDETSVRAFFERRGGRAL